MTEEKETTKVAELKSERYSIADVGKQANQYSKTTKAISEYAGRVYGLEMKMLVLGYETVPKEPEYPTTETDKTKAIWSKEYDMFMKKKDKYRDYKAKVFTIIIGQCDPSMRNKIEHFKGFSKAETTCDVIELLRIIKDIAFDANEKKYPAQQVVLALKTLASVGQYEKEELVDYFKRFISSVEVLNRSVERITVDKKVKLAMTAVAPTPIRITKLEETLNSQTLTCELAALAGKEVRNIIKPISDVRSSAEYRLHVAGVLLKRALLHLMTMGGK